MPLYCFEQKQLFTPNPNLPLDYLLLKHVETSNVSVNFWASFWESHFLNKKEFFIEIPPKFCKTTENHSLAVYGSLQGEKHFMLIFVPFYWLYKKQLFNQIQIFLRNCPFSNLLWKSTFLSISVLLSKISLFWNKKRSFQYIPPPPPNASKHQKSIV